MSISGHKTRAMFDRYNIVSESDLADAAAKMEAFRAERAVSNALQIHTKSDTAPKNRTAPWGKI